MGFASRLTEALDIAVGLSHMFINNRHYYFFQVRNYIESILLNIISYQLLIDILRNLRQQCPHLHDNVPRLLGISTILELL